MFFSTTIANAGSYFYHFLTGRILGPVDYGTLSSLISLTYFLTLPTTVLNLLIVKKTAVLKEGKGFSGAAEFYYWLDQEIKKFGVWGLLILLLASRLIANFFHYYSIIPVIFIGIFSLFSLFVGVNSSVLLGFLAFKEFSYISVFQSLGKLIICIILLVLGFGVTGAVLSLPVSMILTYFISFLLMQKLFKRKNIDVVARSQEIKTIIGESLPIAVSIVALTSFYTTDLLLVRHFLPAFEAGLYASLANLGKIIFFASATFSQVMFPVISGRWVKKENCRRPFLLSFLGVLAISASLSLIYFAFPKIIMVSFYGHRYLAIAPLMGIFSVFMILYSLISLTINFYLAISRTKILSFVMLAALAQGIMIFIFHQNILQIIWVNIGVLSFLLVVLLLPFVKDISSGG